MGYKGFEQRVPLITQCKTRTKILVESVVIVNKHLAKSVYIIITTVLVLFYYTPINYKAN